MKRVIHLLLCFIILSSCNSNNDLNGIWIGAYKVDYSKKDSSFASIRVLLDFSDDEVIFKKFDYPMFDEKQTSEKVKYLVSENFLILESDTFQIESVTKDSLSLIINSENKQKLVFKKLINDDKNLNINLKNKAFFLQGPNYKDSIEFINDSTFFYIGNRFNTRHRSSSWAINHHKRLMFLVLDQFESPLFLIEDTSENELSLKLFYTNTRNFKLTTIKNTKDTMGLIGHWVSPSLPNTNIPLPPPPPNYSEGIDTRLYLRINTDSLEIEQFEKSKSKRWQLNSTNEFIYFPKEIDQLQGVWKIIELDRNNLTIERNARPFLSIEMERELIKFKKEIKN